MVPDNMWELPNYVGNQYENMQHMASTCPHIHTHVCTHMYTYTHEALSHELN